MRAALLTFAVLLAPALAHAQTLRVDGVVREAGTRRPIPGALIYTEHPLAVLNLETYSDEDGAFVLAFDDLPKKLAQPIVLVVRTDGYEPQRRSLTRDVLGEDTLDIFLKPTGEQSGTLVRERRSKANHARGSHRIEDAEVNELPGTYGDPAKAIENFPGMGRVKRSQGSLFVRGAQPEESAIYVDDYEVPDLYHFTGSTSVINIPFIESVELVPGAFSARFGRATGGLVQLRTRRLPTDDVHGFAKLDVIDGGAYVGVPLSKKAAVGASARRSWIDLIRRAQLSRGLPTEDVTLIPTYWDYQLKLDWDVADGHELVVFAFGSGDRELYLRGGSNTSTAYRRQKDSDFHRASVRYKHTLGNGLTNTATVVLGYEDRLFNELSGLRYSRRRTFDTQLREELVWRSGDTRITAGVDATARLSALRFAGFFADTRLRSLPAADLAGSVRGRQVQASRARATAALYVEGDFQATDRLLITPGARLDTYWYNASPDVSVEPRMVAAYTVVKGDWGLDLKGAGGIFGRPPSDEEVFAASLVGQRLPPQRAGHLQAGIEQRLGTGSAFTATAYLIGRKDLTSRSPTFPVAESVFVPAVSATTSGMSVGAEFLLRTGRSKRYFAWLSYGIARHVRVDGNSPRAVQGAYPDTFDSTHLLTALGQVHLPWGFRVGLRARAATGQPRTDVIGSVLDADSGLSIPIEARKATGRFPLFFGLDGRLDWSYLMSFAELDLYVDLVNMLNIRPVEGTLYNHDYTEQRDLNGLPLIPTFGFKVTF